jgi:hypothetical protein
MPLIRSSGGQLADEGGDGERLVAQHGGEHERVADGEAVLVVMSGHYIQALAYHAGRDARTVGPVVKGRGFGGDRPAERPVHQFGQIRPAAAE